MAPRWITGPYCPTGAPQPQATNAASTEPVPIRVFSGGETTSYVSLDYQKQEGYIYRIARDGEEESNLWKKLLHAKDTAIVSEFGGKRIVREPVPIEKDDPLLQELRHFVQCVCEHQTPKVSGESGKQALDVALEITRQIQELGTK